MKYKFALVTLVLSLQLSFAEGIEFHHGTWAEALAKSRESGKLIFIDAFTSWCGPCKMMSAKTFPQKEVGDFYNTNFVNVKMDMEKGEGPQLAGTYGVNAYPTLLFIDSDGKLVMKAVGYMEPDRFITTGQGALKRNDKSDLYAKEYASGKRDFATIYNYVHALNLSGKPSLKIANDYINSQKDLSTPENIKFLYEAATEVDSRIFDLMMNQKDKLINLYGTDGIQTKILAAANKTVKKGIEYKSNDLLNTAQDKISNFLPAEYVNFNFESNLAYYTGVNDAEGLLKTMKRLPAEVEKNIIKVNTLAREVETTFGTDGRLLALCEQLLSKATQAADVEPSQLFTLARIYALNKKSDKADKTIDQAISLAKSKHIDPAPMESFKQLLPKS